MKSRIKRTLFILTIFIMSLTLIGCGAKRIKDKKGGDKITGQNKELPQDMSDKGNATLFDFSEGNDEYAISKYKGTRKEVTIPKEHKGKKIVAILDAFSGNTQIEKVNIPETIRFIEEEAFINCTNLKTVNLAEGVIHIGAIAFAKTSVESFILPNSAINIGGGAFGDAKVSVKEGNENFEVREECLINIAQKQIVLGNKNSKIPADIKRIGTSAFALTGLEHIEVHAGVNDIEPAAFGDAKVTIAKENAIFEAKENCVIAKGTKRVISGGKYSKIPEGVKVLASLSFADSEINDIRIPDSVNLLEDKVFARCRKLKKVEIGSGLKTIHRAAFMKTALEEITIPSSVEQIGESAFEGSRELKQINLSEGLKDIGIKAFWGTKINTINIPSTVETIGGAAFGEADVTLSSGNSKIEVKNGCVIEKDTKKLVNAKKTAEIPSDVKIIARYAFFGSERETFVIPANVEIIETSAFSDCKNLKKVELKEGLKEISDGAFQNCHLQSIVIPLSVEKIGDRVFAGNEKLKKIYCRATKEPDTGWSKIWNSNHIMLGSKYEVAWGYTN